MRRLLAFLLPTLVLAVLLVPSQAQAHPAMFSIMMDDDQLLYRGDNARDAALRRMRDLGVDYVRVTVLWEVVAEHARFDRRGKRRPNFKADNPRTYPRGVWDKYDRLVQAGRTLGIGIYFNVTGPGPRWAHKKPPKKLASLARTYKPKPREFFKFVKAVGKRYDGTYIDENDGNRKLPRVGFWSIYNEPNQGGWLTPQYEKRGSKVVPWSPVMYRELFYYGRAALNQTGHERDVVLIGETAPLGSGRQNPKSSIRPKKFIREMFCITPTGSQYSGSSAAKRQCNRVQRFGPYVYTAWAHHPYTKDLPPTALDRNRDSITMGNISHLAALLDQIGEKTGLIPKANATMLTEFGWESDPPDPFSGVPLADQAEFINHGDYLAYKDPRIFGNTQFLLRDVDPVKRAKKGTKRYWFTYQSGLQFADGRPKPAAAAYSLPIHVIGKGTDSVGQLGVNLWGWVRFLPPNTDTEVVLQYRPQGGTEWSTIGDPVKIDSLGFFTVHRAVPTAGSWRAIWINPVSKNAFLSREADFEG